MVRRLLESLPPEWLGFRWVKRAPLRDAPGSSPRVNVDVLQPAQTESHPLPENVPSRGDLPTDRGWWGYSFHDVPARTSGETLLATVRGAVVTWYRDPARGNDFYPAILTADGLALEHRELKFRPPHRNTLLGHHTRQRIERATWVLERVYHNHSHWLTAHLPKLLLLQERGLDMRSVLLPSDTASSLAPSLAAVGLDPRTFGTFREPPPLEIDELTLVGTDRFRPDLLRRVPAAAGTPAAGSGTRRIYISRARAARRHLVNEAEIWPLFARAGFECVAMETLPFPAQVAMLQEAAVVAGLHGAGLTNMLFCPSGTHVVEIADLSFPNPNFYALASALGHRYWLVPGTAAGDGHPIDRDVRVAAEPVRAVLAALAS